VINDLLVSVLVKPTFNIKLLLQFNRMEDIFHLGIKAIIRNSEGRILLLKVNPKKLKKYSGEPYWDIPGGRIHKNSNIEDTLKREVREETGITSISSFSPFTMVLSNNVRIPVGADTVGLILSSYICNVGDIKSITISDEHIDFGWFSPKETGELLAIKYPKEFVDKLSELK